MWNHKPQAQDAADDDSWEVRSFAEDTANIMGTTWPPRSYSCIFCRREFRSAQALGGHMNVHRRDRARLHQTQPANTASMNPTPTPTTSTSATTTVSSPTPLITRQFPRNGGSCLLYQSANPYWVFGASQPMRNACSIDSPSTRLSISQYPSTNLMVAAATASPLGLSNSSSLCSSTTAEPATTSADYNINLNDGNNTSGTIEMKETSTEELDLELRLGHRSTAS